MAEDTRYRSDFSREHASAQDQADTPAREPAADPLTELARLIGQSDPFVDLKGRRASAYPDAAEHDARPAPEWLARSPESPEQDQQGYADTSYPQSSYAESSYRAPQRAADYRPEDYAPISSYARQPAHDPYAQDYQSQDYQAQDYQPQDYQPQPAAYADDRHADHTYNAVYNGTEADPYQVSGDDRYRVALPTAEYEGDSYYADDGHLPPRGEDMLNGRRRGGLVTVIAVLGLAVIGTAGAFGYRAFTSGSADATPPVIKADTTPAKIVPATAPTDQQNKPFQERVGAANPVQTERIVPREEPPVATPVGTPRAAAPALPPPIASAPALPATPVSPNEPKRVRTVTIKQEPNGEVTATTPPPAAARPAPAATKQPRGTPLTIAPASEPAPARTPTRTASIDGAYVVQVSAQKTEGEAQSSYRALQAKYPAVLGGREASIRRADLGDKGVYYRAQVGPFPSLQSATAFCDNLKAAGGQCIAQKN